MDATDRDQPTITRRKLLGKVSHLLEAIWPTCRQRGCINKTLPDQSIELIQPAWARQTRETFRSCLLLLLLLLHLKLVLTTLNEPLIPSAKLKVDLPFIIILNGVSLTTSKLAGGRLATKQAANGVPACLPTYLAALMAMPI